MNSNIYFTPSQEQLLEIAKQSPDLHEKIKQEIVKELIASGIKANKDRLQKQSSELIAQAFKKQEANYFTRGDGWKTSTKFNPAWEKKIEEKINSKIDVLLTSSIESSISNPEFATLLQRKIYEQLINYVLKELDSKIAAEAKKLTE